MTYVFVNIALAAVPSFLLLLYFYRKDRERKEPPVLVFKVFLVGFAAVIPAAGIEIILGELGSRFQGIVPLLVRAFIVVALVEETAKFAVIRLYVYPRSDFDEAADGVVYTIAASLGFAFFENILYSLGPPSVIIIRGITAVPLHAIASGILGYYIGISKVGSRNVMGRGLAWAVLIHGAYDFLLFTETLYALLVFPLLLIGWIKLGKLYRKAIRDDRLEGRN